MNTSDRAFSLDEIPIDIIERIEVYKSIIPARFGCDGLGGAVNIVTKEFSTDYLDASYELGSFQTHKGRSEEHTSELQSRQYLVCRLLLEKKKKSTRLNSSHANISYAVFCLQ